MLKATIWLELATRINPPTQVGPPSFPRLFVPSAHTSVGWLQTSVASGSVSLSGGLFVDALGKKGSVLEVRYAPTVQAKAPMLQDSDLEGAASLTP
jgi:hypothetical protein